ncbi:hypothetical protein CPAR01_06148 [Colletotrichum paranaense]|uniref:Uncharacterized protein n=1 Tax=Colletotrichum paranaense TaxID=1914294 RepID=A0ABQ9STB3_9PEZI|nr:uncharacterized protein CPAR01_06148 [Colletotrichum paranaense]KAK1542761.1 hypothetical protein CPAR01_06148 [Colletotrichum paranaense]
MQPSRGLLQMDDEFKLKKDHLPKRSSPISDPPKTRSPCTGRPWSLGRDNSTAPGRSSAGRVAERLEATGNGSRQRAEEAEHAESPATQPDAALVYGYMNGDLITYGFRLVEAKLLVLGMRLSVQPAKYPYTLSPDINEAPAALTNGPQQQMAYNLCESGSCSLYLNKVFDGPQAPVGISPERQTKKESSARQSVSRGLELEVPAYPPKPAIRIIVRISRPIVLKPRTPPVIYSRRGPTCTTAIV